MSRCRSVEITCPSCGQKSQFTIWDSINTTLDPEMKSAVRNRSAFAFVCPHCGDRSNVNYGFLYHQMEDRILIHYVTSDEEAKTVEEMYSANNPITAEFPSFRDADYMVRIVFSQNQLLEKLAIIDAGLDDRLVEIYKVFLLANAQKEKPDLGDAEILMLTDAGKHYLQFLSDNKSLGYAEMSMDTYRLLEDEFGDSLLARSKQGPYVDRRWALEFIKLTKR